MSRFTPLLVSLAFMPFDSPSHGDWQKAKAEVEAFRGKVIRLADYLKRQGIEAEPDEGTAWLALETEDKKLFPIVKDSGSRPFYRDPRLLGRPMEIRGRLLPGSGLLQIYQAQSLKEGKLHEVYYWCDVCAIKRYSLEKTGICECCGGPMELREVPAAPR
jgi:hypothetical protein